MDQPLGRLVPGGQPRGLIGGQMIVLLNKPLGDIPTGSLVSWPIADVAAGKAGATVTDEARAAAARLLQGADA